MQWGSNASDPEVLATKIRGLKKGLVVLEGCQSAGKSHLADTLCELIPGITVVHGDEFIAQKDTGYMAGMNIDALRQAVCEGLRKSPIAIFDGILARDLLEEIGHWGDLFVYVQRNSTVGVPGDWEILIQEEDEPPEPFGAEGVLAAEVAEYHRRRRPCANAGIIFIRVGD